MPMPTNDYVIAEGGIAGLTPDSSRPAEMFFAGISKGDTPETSQFCKIAAEWTEEWIGRMKAAFGSAA